MSFPSQFKFKVTLVCQSSKRQVILPKDIDYHGLLAYVQKKFDIISIHDFSLYYKCDLEVFEVKDEDDVQFFVHEVCGQKAPENELSDWAAAKVYDRMLKSANWTVRPIDHLKLFQVYNKLEVHQVDLVAFQCSCRKWQLSGLPCGHVCAVCRVSGLTNCNLWAKPWFKKTTLKSTYQELVYPLKDPKMWQAPNELQLVLPPVMIKRPAGRPKNKNRILSTNESATIPSCTRCGMEGHNRNGCNQPFPTIVESEGTVNNQQKERYGVEDWQRCKGACSYNP
ncbi:transposase, MuDR, MULE transposase domain protein [Tanacetum coccineum]